VKKPDALEQHQTSPCEWCCQEPKRKGDHLGAKCRALLDAKWQNPSAVVLAPNMETKR
jgi:hypothetical protein